jgi:hypothetical protein
MRAIRTRTGLIYATLFFATWTTVSVLAPMALDIAIAVEAPLSAVEGVIVDGNLLVLENLPFLLLPALLAPAGVVLRWLVPRFRPPLTGCVERERAAVKGWLGWIGASFAVALIGAFLAVHQPWRVPTGVWAWVLLAFSWGYAGALDRSFRVHDLRRAAGDTRWDVVVLVFVGAVTLAAGEALGPVVPLWVLWASRGSRGCADS